MFENIELFMCVHIPASRPSSVGDFFLVTGWGYCPLFPGLMQRSSIWPLPLLWPWTLSPVLKRPIQAQVCQEHELKCSFSPELWNFLQFSCFKKYMYLCFLILGCPLGFFWVHLVCHDVPYCSCNTVTFLGSQPLPPSSKPAVAGRVLMSYLSDPFFCLPFLRAHVIKNPG